MAGLPCRIAGWLSGFLLLWLIAAPVQNQAAAQGTVQTSILGVPPVLPSPMVEDVIRDYERGLYPIQVMYSHPSRQAATFRFRVGIELDNDLLFEITSDPVLIRPGVHTYRGFKDSDVHFRDDFSAIIDRIQRSLRSNVIRTGGLPEGTYVITVEAVPEDPFISSMPGSAMFTVRLAEPPLVVAPMDGVVVSQPYPIFSWLPVASPLASRLEYHIVLVELMDRQMPQEAVLGNRPHLSTTTSTTTLVYGPENLPLVPGRTYAWQISAQDIGGRLPISNGGRSEIHTFTYDKSGRLAGDIRGLTQIDLVPNFARLTSLELDATEQQTSYRLNGRAILELDLEDPVAIPVEVSDMDIQKTGLDRPVLMGGAVHARLRPGMISAGMEADFIELTQLNWRFEDGFTVDAQLDISPDHSVAARGTLRMTPRGLSGSVSADLAEPMVLGVDPVEVHLNRVEATFPAAQLHASGDVFMFGKPTSCGVDRVNLQLEDVGAYIDCRPETGIALVDGSDRLLVNLERASGTFSADLVGNDHDYDIRLRGGVDLATSDGGYCGADGGFHLTPGGVQVDALTPTCGPGGPYRIDLGVIDVELTDLIVNTLSYHPGSGWDFAFDLDGDFRIPAIDPAFRWSLSDFQLTRHGFNLPAVNIGSDGFQRGSDFNIGGFGLSVDQLRIEPLTFPWFDWSGEEIGPWDVTINGGIMLPAAAHLPGCISGSRFDLNDFRIHSGGISGSLPFTAVDDCALEIGPSAAFIINQLGGRIAGDFDGGALTLRPSIDLDAQLSVGTPFVCEGERASSIARLSFAPGAGGTLSGTIENVVPQCPVAIGPLRAAITDATLELDGWNGEQGALLSADASLALSPTNSVNGTFGLDLTTGTFTALNFVLDDPFEWALPAQSPLLTFRIQSAHLGLDGFSIDGRQELVLPDGSTLGATFDNMRADIEHGIIEDGEIIFDTGFALEAGILGQTLNFSARPAGSTLSARPGVLIDLPSTVRVSSRGLTASGTAQAQIDFGEWSTDLDVAAVFSPDFALGVDPVGVAQGRVDLEAGGLNFAYIDSDGFHPNPAAVAGLIPDVLPLPSEDIAYLELRRDGDLVVDVVSQPDGTLLIETLPGESLDLVLPYVDGTPRIAATLADVRVRRSGDGFVFENGLIDAVAPTPIDLGSAGIPMTLRSVKYGYAGSSDGAAAQLILSGALHVFGESLGGSDVTLAVSSVGDLSGMVDLDGVSHRIDIAGDGLVGVDIESVSGSFTMPRGGQAAYDWTVAGAVSVNDGDTELASAQLALRHQPHRTDVLQFIAGTDLEGPSLDLGTLQFDFDGITELKHFSYTPESGFEFRLAVDFGLGLSVDGGDAFGINLKGVEISETSLSLPAQTVHGGTMPALDDSQMLTVGPVDLRLIGIELIRDVQVNYADLQLLGAGRSSYDDILLASTAPIAAPVIEPDTDLFDALNISLGISINAYPSLSDVEFSVYNAGFNRGMFTGALEAFSFIPGAEPRLAIGESAGLILSTIAGELTIDESGFSPVQGFSFDLGGRFELPSFFETEPSAVCPDMQVSLRYENPGALRGSVQNFAACGSIAFGPASLEFPSSTLEFDLAADGAQSATLDGSATATLSGTSGDITASGPLRLDLLTGRLLSGSLSLTGSFGFGLPADDPIFEMQAQQLTIDNRGVVVDGNGALEVGDGTAGITFNSFAIDPREWVVVDGSMNVESGFAFEVGLSGSPSWSVTDAGSAVEDDAALRLDVPANVTLDPVGLHVGGSSTAALHYGGETYASLSVDFASFSLGLSPVAVRQGRADFSTTDGTRIAYYDANGFHFDAGGIIAAVVPERLPLPTEDVAYLRLRDEEGNILITYEQVEGGYAISSLQSGGSLQPLELVIPALGEPGSHPTLSLTLDNLHVNSTMQQVMSGSIEASVNEALTQSLGIPLQLETIRYARNDDGDFALTTDGRIDLPAELGETRVNFADLGITSSGFTGDVLVGEDFAGNTCQMIGEVDSPSAIAATAFSSSGIISGATPAQLIEADLGLALFGLRLTFDPDGGHSFGIFGEATSRITGSMGDTAGSLPFLLGYENDLWRADACANLLPSDDVGKGRLSLNLADLYLDADAGGGASIEIGDGHVELTLSGMLALPEILGGEFRLSIEDLAMGTRGIRIASAGAGLSGQETTLFGDVLKLRNDNLGVAWDADSDALALTLDGSMWLTPFMCTDGNPTACADQDAVSFSDLRIDTRGIVSLGGGAVNLLAARQEPLSIIGNNPDPTLGIDVLALRKPDDANSLFLDIGGELNLPELADGVSSSFLFSVNNEGHIESEEPLHMRFVREPANPADQVDERGDNPATEIDFGGFALLDVKEAGLAFNGGQLSRPAVYASGSIYIQEGVDNQIRLGTLGGKTASSAGMYVDFQTGLSINPQAEIDEFDLGGFLSISDISVATNQHTERGTQFVLGGKVDVQMEGLASASADWRDLTLDRQGIADHGRLGSGGLNLTIVEVVSLSIGAIDYGSGTFEYYNPATEETEQKTAETYFAMTGAEVSLTDAMKGGVDAIYYYRNGDDVAFEIYNANISLSGMVDAALTMRYVNEQGNVLLSAAGRADVDGIGALAVAGQMGRRVVDSNPVTSFGLFVSLESTTGVPIIPGIVTLTSVGGGFFNYPDAAILSDVENLLGGYDLVPPDRKPALDDIRFAALLHGGAGLIGQGVYMLEGSLLFRVTNQHSSIFAEAKYLSLDEIRAGFYLNVHYGQMSGLEGGAAMAIDFPSVLDGNAGVNFAAYDRPEGILWMIDGSVELDVLNGIAEAGGDFIASNDGMLLRELRVSLASPKIYIIEVKADAEMSFWYVPDAALGAYGELAVSASVLGGLAEAGADLKGAYIREDELIYMAASAYVSVLFVFEGRLGIWASLEKGSLKGGTGKNARYDQMVADARQHAEDMIARANEMAAAMEAARTAPFEFDPETIRQAGLQLVSANASDRAWYAESLLCNEQGLYTSSCSQLDGSLSRMQGLTRNILTGYRPFTGVNIDAEFRSIERSVADLQERAAVVEQYLRDLEVRAIEWQSEAADMFADMQLQSPLTAYSPATYSGEGDERRMTSAPSFHIDTQRDNEQVNALTDLKQEVDALDDQYREAIQSAAHNLGQITDLISGSVVFDETSWMRRSTTVNHVASSYAELTADVQRVFAAQADSLWKSRDWATGRHNAFTSGAYAKHHFESLMDVMISNYTSAGRFVHADALTCNRFFWIQQLRRLGDETFDSSQQNAEVSGFCNTITGYRQQARYDLLAREFKSVGVTLWHDVPREGLQLWSQQLESSARQNRSLMEGVLTPIQDGHLALTKSVDRIYLLQTEMAATVHGMLEEYISWRRGSQGLDEGATDAAIDHHEGMRQSLLRALAPPTINGVSVNRRTNGYTGTADIDASISHSEEVAQVSYRFQRGSSTNIYTPGDYVSNGRSSTLSLHTFADQPDESTQDWTVLIRARGPLGSAATRVANFTVAVASAGRNDAPSGYVPDVMPEDTSPPTRPILNFPEYSSALDQNSVRRRWTNEGGRLVFTVIAVDAESDIAGYEYRIGTTTGGSEVRDWTEAVGVPLLEQGQEGVLGNAIRQITVHGLMLDEGVPYFVSVRARNGAGLIGSVQSDSRGVVFDSTPPTAPAEGNPVADLGTPPETSSSQTFTGQSVMSPPSYLGPMQANTQPVQPSFVVRWIEASDTDSGIKEYEYVVSTNADPEGAFEVFATPPPGVFYLGPVTRSAIRRTKNLNATISGLPVRYANDVYVHVRAINNAGSPGDVLTIGPVRPVDPTAPRHPNLKAMVDGGSVDVYLTRPGYDLETSVQGYQYAISRMSGIGHESWVRPFPSNGSIDFAPKCGTPEGGLFMLYTDAFGNPILPDEFGCYLAYEQEVAPHHRVNLAQELHSRRASTDGEFFIYIRTINQQGQHSVADSRVGPIILDATEPLKPSITSSTQAMSGGGVRLTLKVEGVHDPESGILGVEYRFSSGSSWESWQSFASIYGKVTRKSNYTRTRQFASGSVPNRVQVRLTNGAGLQRVTEHCINGCTPPILYIPPPITYTPPVTYTTPPGVHVGFPGSPLLGPGVVNPHR